MKRLQLKLSKFRRAYSSPDFNEKVLEKWTLRSWLRIDLSTIRNAIVAEVEDGDGVVDFDRVRKRNVVRGRVMLKEMKQHREEKSLFFFFFLCGFVWLLRNEFCELFGC